MLAFGGILGLVDLVLGFMLRYNTWEGEFCIYIYIYTPPSLFLSVSLSVSLRLWNRVELNVFVTKDIYSS